MNHQTPSEKKEQLDKFIFYGLFTFAIFSCISRIGSLAALSVTTILIVIRHRLVPYRKTVPAGIIGAYIIFICLLIPSMAFTPDLRNNFRPFLNIVFDIAPFLLAWFGITNKKQITPLIAALAFSLAVSSASIIYQSYSGGFNPYLRFASFGYHCMATSGFAGILLPLLGVFVLEQRELPSWLKAGLITAAFLGAVALLINMNRGVWASMAGVTFAYLLVKSKNIFRLAVTALIFSAVIVIGITTVPSLKVRAGQIWNDGVSFVRNYQMIFQETPTADIDSIIKYKGVTLPERVYIWNGAWRMFHEHPWSGVGLGSVDKVFQSRHGYISPLAYSPGEFVHAHNNFLQFLAAAGIPGFLGFMGLFIFVLWVSIRHYKINPANWWTWIGFFVTISFLIQGLTEYNYVHSALVRLYWFVFGVSMMSSSLSPDHAGSIQV